MKIALIVKKKAIIFYVLLLITLGLAFFVPNKVDILFNYLCFAIFLIMTVFFFRFKKKKNYFDFDSIFIIIYAIVGFVFPVFLFSFDDPFQYFFSLKFDIRLVSKGIYIALLGIAGYYTGSIFRDREADESKSAKTGKIDTTFLIFIVIIFTTLFFLMGGIKFYRSMYQGSVILPPGPVLQVMSLMQAFIITTMATEAYNLNIDKTYKINKIFLFVSVFVALMFLYAGNRTIASLFLLSIGYWYIKTKHPLNFIKFTVLIFCAIIFMWVIQFTRTGSDIELNDNIKVLSDLLITERNTYVGIEYTDKYGYTYGKTMLSGAIGVIPSLERVLSTLFGVNIREYGSAELFTDYTFRGSINRFGLGTNIFIDIYISYGYVGTFLILFFLGYLVKYAFLKIKERHYYYYIIYTVLIAHAVFIVRASVTYPLKLIIWGLIIGNLNKSLINRFLNYKNRESIRAANVHTLN